MPNQTLLEQLDNLRDAYVQQQRAVAGLQATLKAVTNTHSKAQKALRDFPAHKVGIEVSNVQEALARTRLKEESIDPMLPDLRRELKNQATLAAALKDVTSALRSEPVDVVRLDRAITSLQAFKQQDVQEIVPQLSEELDLAQRALGDEFGQKLRAALSERGIQIGGRAPKFEIGRFELEANFARRFITLRYGRDIVVPHAPVTVEGAVRAYESAAKSVAGRNQDGKSWIAQFHEAYQLARRKRAADGTRINIVDCYLELVLLRQGRAFAVEPTKRTFSEYMRAQFIYDFHEFTDRQCLAHNGQVVKAHTATKSQTDSPTKSMWIVEGDTPYDGRYIADVEFVKE